MVAPDLARAIPQIGASGVPNPVTAPISAYRYADAKRQIIDMEAKARPLIRLWDNRMHYIGTVASEKSVSAEELLHDTGQSDIAVRASDWLVEFLRHDVRKDEDLHLTIDPYPHNRNWRWRWGGKVNNVRVGRNENGIRTATFESSHNREHWKHLYFGATPFTTRQRSPSKRGSCGEHPHDHFHNRVHQPGPQLLAAARAPRPGVQPARLDGRGVEPAEPEPAQLAGPDAVL